MQITNEDFTEIDLFINNRKTIVRVVQGDITKVRSDAIVNAANNQLWMGSGVAGAIKRIGGPSIEAEALKLGPIPIGEAVPTNAGLLKAKYVIHAAAMGADLRTDATKIADATYNSLLRAHELELRSIAFPSIGTGVGGFPMDKAAEVMVDSTLEFFNKYKITTVNLVIFVLFDSSAYAIFKKQIEKCKI